MQKLRRLNTVQLVLISSFLSFSCSAPNYRVNVSFDKEIPNFRSLKKMDDISIFYSNFEDEERLERSFCRASNGIFEAEHHKKTYSNSKSSFSLYVNYEGTSKEEFLRKCIALDEPKTFFSYNDFLPYVQNMAENVSSFYTYYDFPKENIHFDINRESLSFVSFSSFLEERMPKKQYENFCHSESISLMSSFYSNCIASFVLLGETNSKETFYLDISPN